MFVILSREHDMFYQAVQNMWCNYKSSCALSIPMFVVALYMRDRVPSGTRLGRDLIQILAETVCSEKYFSGYIRCAR